MSSNIHYPKLTTETKGLIKEITVDELTRQTTSDVFKPLLIDVRETGEFLAAHALGALHMSHGTLTDEIEAVVPDVTTPIVLYCADGNRSAFAAESLRKMGYARVASLVGGFCAWLTADQPVVLKRFREPGAGFGAV